ncbi:MAG: DUF5612 domain-containing protein [Candidatus Hydrothermarchaeota archaeon]
MIRALNIIAEDRPGVLKEITTIIAEYGSNIVYVHAFSRDKTSLIYLEVEEVQKFNEMVENLKKLEFILEFEILRPFQQIFGKRIIVIGGGAQVSQVVLGAVTEADRQNIRGDRISVDTIPLVGEKTLAEAVRAVGRLHRASILVLAGSIMGGEISQAVRELREKHGIPVISLNMAGSVPEVSDLVVTDPVQAGVLSVMMIAERDRIDVSDIEERKL